MFLRGCPSFVFFEYVLRNLNIIIIMIQKRTEKTNDIRKIRRNKRLQQKRVTDSVSQKKTKNTKIKQQQQPIIDNDVSPQQQKQIQTRLDDLTEKIIQKTQQLQTKINLAKQSDVIQAVKKQIQLDKQKQMYKVQNKPVQTEIYQLQNQKIPKQTFLDSGIPFSRSNYKQIIQRYINKINEILPQQGKKMQKFLSTRNSSKIYSYNQLKNRALAINSRYNTIMQGYPKVQHLLKLINKKKKQMQQSPQQWYHQYLLNRLNLQEDSPQYDKLKQSHIFFTKQFQQNYKKLQERQSKVKSKATFFGKSLQQQRLMRVQKLQQLSQQLQRQNLFQKKVMLFKISQSTDKVQKLQNTIQENQQKYQNDRSKIIQDGNKIISEYKNQQKLNEINIENYKKQIVSDRQIMEKQRLIIQKQQQQQIKQNQKFSQVLIDKSYTIQQLEIQLINSKAKQTQLALRNRDLHEQNIQLRNMLINQRSKLQIHQQTKNANLIQKIKQFQQKHQVQLQQMQKQYKSKLNQLQKILLSQKQNKVKLDQQYKLLLQKNQQSLKNIKVKIQQQFKKKFTQNNQKWQVQLSTLKFNHSQDNRKYVQYIKSKEKQFSQFEKKYHDDLTTLLQQKQTLENQKHIIQRNLQMSKQHAQNYLIQYQNHNSKLKKQMEDAVNQLQIRQTKLLQQQRSLNKQKQQKLKKIIEILEQKDITLQQYENSLQNLEKQILKQKKQRIDANNQIAKYKQLAQKYQKKQVNLQYRRWNNAHDQTIRLCFKYSQQLQWIPSTRGINYPFDKYNSLKQVFEYWLSIYKSKQFPLIKIQKKIKDTNILMVLDVYKQKKYFCLRQYYYKYGNILPTRRGFNIQHSHLQQFLSQIYSIKQTK